MRSIAVILAAVVTTTLILMILVTTIIELWGTSETLIPAKDDAMSTAINKWSTRTILWVADEDLKWNVPRRIWWRGRDGKDYKFVPAATPEYKNSP